MTTESTWVGIVGVAIMQIAMFAKILVSDKRKANESHVKSVEKSQDRLYDELNRMRDDLNKLQAKLDELHAKHMECETSLSAAKTRMELLEKFRDVAAADDPTGATRRAMPPPPEICPTA